MGNNEESKSSKTEKASSPSPPDQNNTQLYPDWAAMQAYYGPRVPMPPYYNSAVASGHAPPPYMWGPPSPMMPPYGAPYPAFCPPGGVYVHPGVPVQSQGLAVQSSTAGTTPMNIETPAKSPVNTDQGFMKKLKEFDGLAMSIGNSKAESAERGGASRMSQSTETEGSSNGSDGNTTGGEQYKRKRSREGTPTIGANGNAFRTVLTAHAIELGNSAGTNCAPQPCSMLPTETWTKNERELKRERRKQSNRESARRSRLRKQAEAEELARNVGSLKAENSTLRSEINQFKDKSENLRLENAALLEKLKSTQVSDNIENLLSKVNSNSGSDDRRGMDEHEGDSYRKASNNTNGKLHQLLDTSCRTDAVPAS